MPHLQPSELSSLIEAWFSLSTAPSPFHGRSRTVEVPDLGWVSFKGGGWTWGEKRTLISRKDRQMVFGLFGQSDAERELAVSSWLGGRTEDAAIVLGWIPLCNTTVFPHEFHPQRVKYIDETPVNPVILATRSRIPIRVADLAFIQGAERNAWLQRARKAREWTADNFSGNFGAALGAALARLHLLGGTNDSLTWDNVTLAAEWTDFEWLYIPGHELPDGSTDERLPERQWKSCIDAFEVVDKLEALLGGTTSDRRAAIRCCLNAYEKSGGPVSIGEDWNG